MNLPGTVPRLIQRLRKAVADEKLAHDSLDEEVRLHLATKERLREAETLWPERRKQLEQEVVFLTTDADLAHQETAAVLKLNAQLERVRELGTCPTCGNDKPSYFNDPDADHRSLCTNGYHAALAAVSKK